MKNEIQESSNRQDILLSEISYFPAKPRRLERSQQTVRVDQVLSSIYVGIDPDFRKDVLISETTKSFGLAPVESNHLTVLTKDDFPEPDSIQNAIGEIPIWKRIQ